MKTLSKSVPLNVSVYRRQKSLTKMVSASYQQLGQFIKPYEELMETFSETSQGRSMFPAELTRANCLEHLTNLGSTLDGLSTKLLSLQNLASTQEL